MPSAGERIIRANGVDLCVETFGATEDLAILLIHGVASSMLSWDEALCERLAARGRLVIRYDLRDAGRSVAYPAGAPEYVSRDLVADAVGILDALGVARAHVVGMSGGAAVAQLLALDHADRVASLTLASSTPFDGGSHGDLPSMSPELAATFEHPPPEPDWTDREAVIDHLVEAERPYAARSRPFDEARARALAARVVARTTDVAASLANPLLVDTGDPWRERLGEVRAPTLVVHGTEDPLLPFGHAEALAREIPGAELLALEQMGHEHFPPHTWDVVVPALLRHTAAR
jgi:pimeloyl-ACP methyl ester carboxylesterase